MVITDVRIDDYQKGIMERGVENSAAGRASPIEWEISNNSAPVFQHYVMPFPSQSPAEQIFKNCPYRTSGVAQRR